MSTCADCRYCAPQGPGTARRRWPRPSRWFDQPCLHCSHRLKAHEQGVPGAMTVDVGRVSAVAGLPSVH